jgi:hypothetical protein
MSFDYNPFKHIELVETEEGKKVVLHCHSCGWNSSPIPWGRSISEAFAIAKKHIESSHRRTEADFIGWSNY